MGSPTRAVPGLDNARKRLTEAIQTYVQSLGDNLVLVLQNALNSTSTVFAGLMSSGGVFGHLLLIVLPSVYLIADDGRVTATLLRVLPRPWHPRVLELSGLGRVGQGYEIISYDLGSFPRVARLSLSGCPRSSSGIADPSEPTSRSDL
ncbi:hypothetical protein [Deinococcus sp. QL22]|uniref:hypothetical protein n=1 Tax=Deinococcus sp. QL22 TaxID=2939437 RepID=UPI0020178D4D|nr:hypothetical protein [Deinococcus sp. QL22]UQN09642.1 hypothetical protein M1R55_26205 [Deinococcus sp. QL22]